MREYQCESAQYVRNHASGDKAIIRAKQHALRLCTEVQSLGRDRTHRERLGRIEQRMAACAADARELVHLRIPCMPQLLRHFGCSRAAAKTTSIAVTGANADALL